MRRKWPKKGPDLSHDSRARAPLMQLNGLCAHWAGGQAASRAASQPSSQPADGRKSRRPSVANQMVAPTRLERPSPSASRDSSKPISGAAAARRHLGPRALSSRRRRHPPSGQSRWGAPAGSGLINASRGESHLRLSWRAHLAGANERRQSTRPAH